MVLGYYLLYLLLRIEPLMLRAQSIVIKLLSNINSNYFRGSPLSPTLSRTSSVDLKDVKDIKELKDIKVPI